MLRDKMRQWIMLIVFGVWFGSAIGVALGLLFILVKGALCLCAGS